MTFPSRAALGGEIGVNPVRAVLIVGNYAHHWQALPLAGRHMGRLFVFVDHRTTLSARQQAIREHIPLTDVDSFEVFFADQSPFGCSEGAHLWVTIESLGMIVGGRCEACGYAEITEPVRAAVCVERALAR